MCWISTSATASSWITFVDPCPGQPEPVGRDVKQGALDRNGRPVPDSGCKPHYNRSRQLRKQRSRQDAVVGIVNECWDPRSKGPVFGMTERSNWSGVDSPVGRCICRVQDVAVAARACPSQPEADRDGSPGLLPAFASIPQPVHRSGQITQGDSRCVAVCCGRCCLWSHRWLPLRRCRRRMPARMTHHPLYADRSAH